MRIIIDDDQNPGAALIAQMSRAAELALAREGIGHEDCEVSLSFVSPEEMRALNFEYRGVDEATDVLSFPMYESFAQSAPRPGTCSSFDGAQPYDLVSGQGEESQTGFATQNLAGSRSDASAFGPEYCAENHITQISKNPTTLLGDVVICIEVAEKQAEEIGQSVERELLYLFVHSMFHLLGYDHMDDESKSAMRKAEEDVLGEFDTAGQKGTEEILGELSR